MWKDFQFFAGGKSQLIWRTVSYVVLLIIGLIIAGSNGSIMARDLGPVIMVLSLVVIVLEWGIVASRMFNVEIQERTLSSLIALPNGLGSLVWSKIKGCSLAAAPAMAFFVFGALIAPEQLGDGVEELIDEPGAYFFVSQVALMLFLTTYLSLRMKRGAFALSLVLLPVCSGIGAGLFANLFGVDENALAVFGLIVTGTLIVLLANGIAARLRMLAAES